MLSPQKTMNYIENPINVHGLPTILCCFSNVITTHLAFYFLFSLMRAHFFWIYMWLLPLFNSVFLLSFNPPKDDF